MTDATQIPPYRLEWRPYLTARWQLITTLEQHPGELQPFLDQQAQEGGWNWDGQWRLVSQHVCDIAATKRR